jgi:hypothetical protein
METSPLSTFAANLFVGRTTLTSHGGRQSDNWTSMLEFNA